MIAICSLVHSHLIDWLLKASGQITALPQVHADALCLSTALLLQDDSLERAPVSLIQDIHFPLIIYAAQFILHILPFCKVSSFFRGCLA